MGSKGARKDFFIGFMRITQRERKIFDARRDNLLSLCDAMKKIDYKEEQSLRDFYFYCLRERNNGNYYALDCFKKWFPKMFHDMQSILNKRTLIKRDLEIMKALSNNVVFGALTFSDSNLSVNEKNMRKKAQRYLDKTMKVYEIVEEHGTQNTERYHVHYLGILKDDITYLEFHSGWQDYSYIEKVRNTKKDNKRVSKYLCDYIVKQVPTIRRTKQLTKLIEAYKDYDNEKDYKEQQFKWLKIKYQLEVQEELPF